VNSQIAAPEPQLVFEPFVDPDTAAAFLSTSRKDLLQKTRIGKIPGHPLDPTSKKKDWRYKLSELDRLMCRPLNLQSQPPEPSKKRRN
jgi:hypothetical protein